MMSVEWRKLSELDRGRIRDSQDFLPVRLTEIAQAFGVAIKAATLGPGISGEIRPLGPLGYIIRVNRHDSHKRQRFTVAHELAHYLLHRDVIGSGIKDDVLYRSSLSDAREQQANRLAADILMPDDLIASAMDAADDKGEGDIVLYLADLFAVSEAAMRIKLDHFRV